MAGGRNDHIVEHHPAPRAIRGGSSIDGHHLLLGILLFVIAIAAIVGVVVTAASGQGTVAIIIALFAGAFFSRVFC